MSEQKIRAGQGEDPRRPIDQRIRFAVRECSLGSILVAATKQGVRAVLLGDDPDQLKDDLQKRFAGAELLAADANLEALVAQVIAVVEAPASAPDLPLDLRGSAFQQRVWQALRKIPAGSRLTYSDLALAIGAPNSVRAVASACGANALAVLVPCHRVVSKGGGLAGYRWGVERKRELLSREAMGK